MSNTKKRLQPGVYSINLVEVKLPEVTPAKIKYQTDPWVHYGDRNNYPMYLKQMYNRSTTHGAYVDLRSLLISGEGFSASQNIQEYLDQISEDGSADELLDHWGNDLGLLETFAAMVRYSRDGSHITDVFYLDSSTVRPSRDLDERGNPIGYYVSFDWQNRHMFPAEFFPRFDPTGEKEENQQVYFWHRRKVGQPWLPEVSYMACLNHVQLEFELAKYGLSAVVNGFFAGGLLQYKGNFTDEQKEQFVRDVKKTYTGSDNANKLMVVVTEEEDQVKVTPFNNVDPTPILVALKQWVAENIVTRHGGNPILAGIQTGGSSLGSDGKLYRDSLEIYCNSKIRGFQKPIIEFMEKVLNFNNYKNYTLDIAATTIVAPKIEESVLMDFVKPEVLLAPYGFKREDLKPDVLTPQQPIGQPPIKGIPPTNDPGQNNPFGNEAE